MLVAFCTEWPSALDTDGKCDEHFPIKIESTDYVSAGPSVRNPSARIVHLKVSFQDRSEKVPTPVFTWWCWLLPELNLNSTSRLQIYTPTSWHNLCVTRPSTHKLKALHYKIDRYALNLVGIVCNLFSPLPSSFHRGEKVQNFCHPHIFWDILISHLILAAPLIHQYSIFLSDRSHTCKYMQIHQGSIKRRCITALHQKI